MFNLKSFFTLAAKSALKVRASNVMQRWNGTYYFAHVERNKYAPWGRGTKLEGASTSVAA